MRVVRRVEHLALWERRKREAEGERWEGAAEEGEDKVRVCFPIPDEEVVGGVQVEGAAGEGGDKVRVCFPEAPEEGVQVVRGGGKGRVGVEGWGSVRRQAGIWLG